VRRVASTGSYAAPRRVRTSVLDRLLGNNEGDAVADGLSTLRDAVHRDLEALLNAHRPWRSVPAHMDHLRMSSFHYGVPDFTSGALSHHEPREALRRDIETTIRRLEPRLAQVHVHLADEPDRLRTVLRLRIEALLQVEPIVARIAFDTVVNVATAEMVLQLRNGA
jgi:type VI secretion system protein ImpF